MSEAKPPRRAWLTPQGWYDEPPGPHVGTFNLGEYVPASELEEALDVLSFFTNCWSDKRGDWAHAALEACLDDAFDLLKRHGRTTDDW